MSEFSNSRYHKNLAALAQLSESEKAEAFDQAGLSSSMRDIAVLFGVSGVGKVSPLPDSVG